jgi:hypothetical protein
LKTEGNCKTIRHFPLAHPEKQREPLRIIHNPGFSASKLRSTSILIMETGEISETLVSSSTFTLLITQSILIHLFVMKDSNFTYRTLFVTCFMLVSCLAYSSALKMEATCSSETSVDFHRNTRRYISEDITIHNHRCENLKSHYVSSVGWS